MTRGSFSKTRGSWAHLSSGAASNEGDIVGDGAHDVKEKIVDE
jgi:hypothetical protein